MLILALDTTTRGGSAALVEDGAVIDARAGDASRPQAERLPGELMTLLEATGRPLSAIDVYAVAAGPGSFTGVRVGIATMQGLAFAAGKPLVGISALDALDAVGRSRSAAGGGAGSSEPPTVVATWIDAWRGEVYAALYEHGREVDAPTVEPPGRILARLGDRPMLFIGDGAATYADLIRTDRPHARIADPAMPLLAGTVARLAAEAVRAGQCPAPHAIRPLYVRRPDAELARDARAER